MFPVAVAVSVPVANVAAVVPDIFKFEFTSLIQVDEVAAPVIERFMVTVPLFVTVTAVNNLNAGFIVRAEPAEIVFEVPKRIVPAPFIVPVPSNTVPIALLQIILSFCNDNVPSIRIFPFTVKVVPEAVVIWKTVPLPTFKFPRILSSTLVLSLPLPDKIT